MSSRHLSFLLLTVEKPVLIGVPDVKELVLGFVRKDVVDVVAIVKINAPVLV